MIRLRFDPGAQLILLRAEVTGASSRPVVLVLDTGASFTVMSPRVIDALRAPGTRGDWPARVATANGVAEARWHQLNALTLYGEQLGPVEVLSSPLPHQIKADGILGLDILRHFNVTLDFEHGQLALVRIASTQVNEPTPAYRASPTQAA